MLRTLAYSNGYTPEKFMANITFLLIFFLQKVCKNSEQDTFYASRSTGPSFDYSFKTVEIADASN